MPDRSAPAAGPRRAGNAPSRIRVAASLACIGIVALALWLAAPTAAVAQDTQAPRRRPGHPEQDVAPLLEPLRPLQGEPFTSLPDRWRIIENLGVRERWYDPYNQNTLKADRPIRHLLPWFGPQWFLNLGVISDTLIEGRRIPVGVGGQATDDPDDLDVFGTGDQLIAAETVIVETSIVNGNTTFRPPDHEFRIVLAGQYNDLTVGERGIVNVDPDKGEHRSDGHLGIQELLYDRHLRNVSEAYDFDSIRIGIQTFISDFRAFLYQDSQPGIRLFGNRFRNRLQYNAAWFHRLDKDTNSGLNTLFGDRGDDVFVVNGYYQDFLRPGLTVSGLCLYNRNRDGDRGAHFNDNGFIERPASIGDERPKNYDVVYLGSGLDGRLWRLNLTANAFFALGEERSPIASRNVDIFSYLMAIEASMDFDWYRLKLFAFHTPGDEDPFDGEAEGFDAVFENPQLAGADTSYWHRQNIPLVGGGGVALSARNGLIPSLRSSKEEGQSNFVNPGIWLAGAGADLDLTPQLRLTANASYLEFDDTAVLQVVRQQAHVESTIGYDLSAALLWRPLFNQNIVVRLSAAVLVPGEGLADLYDDRYSVFYSTLLNVTLVY